MIRREFLAWLGGLVLANPRAALALQETAEVTLRVEGMI